MPFIRVTLEYIDANSYPAPPPRNRQQEAFVLLTQDLILEKVKLLANNGASPVDQMDWLMAFGEKLATKGDELMYPPPGLTFSSPGKEVEWVQFVEEFCSAIALMAFFPRGVEIFGRRWEASYGCTKA